MNPIQQFNQAMHYIDTHLAGTIDFQIVAQLACCSEYHFRRMFSFLAGMTVSEYIRRRRLSEAAVELRQSDIKVIDLALKYGYDAPDAFSRAFRKLHGVTPTEARRGDAALKAIPPVTFQLTVQGGHTMDYRLIDKPAFYFAGIKKRVTLIYEGVNPAIAAMWDTLTQDDLATLKGLSAVEPRGLLLASTNFSESRAEGSELDQWIGVATAQPEVDGWDVLPVPASTWGVFTVRGPFPETLQQTWARIFAEWFPASGYEISEGPEILWNEGKDTSLPNYHSEIWLPIKKR